MFSENWYQCNKKGYRFQNEIFLFYHDNKINLFIYYITPYK